MTTPERLAGSPRRRRLRRPTLRLRSRVAIGFALLAMATSLVMAGILWVLAVHYVDQQREESARAQATDNAMLLDVELGGGMLPDNEVLSELRHPPDTAALLVVGTRMYRNLAAASLTIPSDIAAGTPVGRTVTHQRTVDRLPFLVSSRRLTAHRGTYVELVPLTDLQDTVRRTWWLLVTAALITTVVGGSTGWLASRRMLRPVQDINRAAAAIAQGDLSARLAPQGDPDLDAIAETFNRTAANLEGRVQADARFAGDVSHELRTPLTTMLNSLAVVQNRRHLLPEEVTEPLDLLAEDLQRFRQLVVDLLDISRVDEGAESVVRESVVIGDLVRHAADSAAGRPVTKVRPSARGVTMNVDKRRMERVLTNLVENARCHGGGCREVVVRSVDGAIRISVRDQGPGVPPDLRDRVFERFARDAAAGGGSYTGSGLGLAIAERHVRLHGGRVWVQDAPGGGAEFTVELPVREKRTARR
ncbi:MAG: HAMP domain-containing histidine kinase [Nocardioidaceae bacterium]|nr:HAMP domain-containing histidine kinase [Nocardioidaceae bacterium]